MKPYKRENLISEVYNCYYQINQSLSQPERAKFHTHFHDFYEILILVEGEIDTITKNKTQHLVSNELIIVPPNSYHLVIAPNSVYKRIIMHFKIDDNYLDIVQKINGITYFSSSNCPALLKFINRFVSHYENLPIEQFNMLAEGLITELILLICNNFKQSFPQASNLKPFTRALLEYIDEHITEKITLKSLAKQFNLAPNYISYFFKDEMHIPIITYIKDKQLTHVHSELKSGKPPTQVFYKYGFTNYSNFFRIYKKTFGHSPSDARKNDA